LNRQGLARRRRYTKPVHAWPAPSAPQCRPESGIYWFRKRVPDRLKAKVGKREIKFSLCTRDPDVARLRNLQAMMGIERAWAAYDLVGVGAVPRSVAPIQAKSVPSADSTACKFPTDEIPKTCSDPIRRSRCERR
jgi:hypothetical protein